MGKSRDERAEGPVEQAGAVPYRDGAGGVEVLLITNNSGRWIVPKGGIDAGQSAADQAAIEAYEEAGVVEAEIGAEVGAYDYERGGRLYHVRLFSLRVRELSADWEESHRREREWVPLAEAVERVVFEGLREAIRSLSPVQNRAAA